MIGLEERDVMETPRTDEHLRMKEENGHVAVVSRDFARQLETELAEARAELERLKKTAEIIPMKTMETIELNGVEYVRKDLLVLVLKMMEAKGLGEAFMTRLVMVLNNYKTERKLEIDRDDLETPRTDRAAFTANFGGSVVVDADFARQLEIELAEAKAKLKKLREKK